MCVFVQELYVENW